MNGDELVVLLESEVAGTLTRRRGGLRFSYDERYADRDDATPLSVSMPTQVAEHGDAVVTPWLWGLLPDNHLVIERWARQFQASASSPFSLLATQVGEDCAGTVQLARPDRVEPLCSAPGSVTWLDEAAVADRIRALRENPTSWLGPDFTGQWSLGGAQAKLALRHEEGRWGVPSGASATTHILKPAIAGLDDHDLNEHLCLSAAGRAGLIVARSAVTSFEDQAVVVVERYDRVASGTAGDDVVRVHQEDLCQALSVHPGRKYQSEGGPSAARIARLLRDVMPPSKATTDVWRFFDALAWNWLIAGTDAHAKNYSLLLSGTSARLAPLYDIGSALPYGEHLPKLKMAMALGGEYRLIGHHRETWPRVAVELGLDAEVAVARIRELALRAPDAFRDVGSGPDITGTGQQLASRLLDEVAARTTSCLAMLR